jgi:transcriptional regulator with XRE-family HTH domain
MTLGQYIAAARARAGLSLRALGAKTDTSAPYLHDLEHDRRGLATSRWPAFLDALPGTSVAGMVDAMVSTGQHVGRVSLDMFGATSEEVEVVTGILMREASRKVRAATVPKGGPGVAAARKGRAR